MWAGRTCKAPGHSCFAALLALAARSVGEGLVPVGTFARALAELIGGAATMDGSEHTGNCCPVGLGHGPAGAGLDCPPAHTATASCGASSSSSAMSMPSTSAMADNVATGGAVAPAS